MRPKGINFRKTGITFEPLIQFLYPYKSWICFDSLLLNCPYAHSLIVLDEMILDCVVVLCKRGPGGVRGLDEPSTVPNP